MSAISVLAATLLSISQEGVELKIDSDATRVDPARNINLELVLTTDRGVDAAPPDLRDRVRGFSLAEDFASEPETLKDGRKRLCVSWKLVPEPCAKTYKIAPFAVGGIVAGPVYFDAPAERESVTGAMELDPKKDLPPLSWKLAGFVAGILALVIAGALAVFFSVRYIMRRVKEHRMSPIERAWVELDRLLKRGLPGRGKYKDFYVELTMVVRRYMQRRHGVKAPHMTTEEFLKRLGELRPDIRSRSESLARFLESADMVKFAGVEATPEMADEATASAREYLKDDDSASAGKGGSK